MIYYYYY